MFSMFVGGFCAAMALVAFSRGWVGLGVMNTVLAITNIAIALS